MHFTTTEQDEIVLIPGAMYLPRRAYELSDTNGGGRVSTNNTTTADRLLVYYGYCRAGGGTGDVGRR
jgi:hypothetical protein